MMYLARSVNDHDELVFESLEELVTYADNPGIPNGWLLFELKPLTEIPGKAGFQPREGEIVTAKCQKCGEPFQGTYNPKGLPPFNCAHCGEHHTGHQFLVAVTDYRVSRDLAALEGKPRLRVTGFMKGPDSAAQPSFISGLANGAIADKIERAAYLLTATLQEMRAVDAFTYRCKDCGDQVEVEAVRCPACVRKHKIEHPDSK